MASWRDLGPKSGPRLLAAAWVGVVLLAGAGWSSGQVARFFRAGESVAARPDVHGAWFWERRCHGVVCRLCPRRCFLPEATKGLCRARVTTGGRLYSLVYARPAALHVDPIEKKPVFHLLPGSSAFSMATAGCNLHCVFCQNWTLSQQDPETLPASYLSPETLVAQAVRSGSRSIAYTYSEPVIFYETMFETAQAARAAGLYNIMISAGYIEPEPLRKLLPLLDVVKIDLKGFSKDYYRRIVGGELSEVLQSLEIIARSGTLLEIVNLVVPGHNDRPEELSALSRWVLAHLGPDTPLFFSRFVPSYRLPNLPPTDPAVLEQARREAMKIGLRYVYIGNVLGSEGENTYCPTCAEPLVRRMGYAVLENRLSNGRCPNCGQAIPGIWNDVRAGSAGQSQEVNTP